MLSVLLAGVTGALVALSFPTYSLDVCIWVALVPLLVAGADASLLGSCCLGWVSGVVFYCGTMPWVLPTIARFEAISVLAALPLFLAFVAYQAVQFVAFSVLAAYLIRLPARRARNSVTYVVLIAAAWVGVEYVFPKIFPWTLATPLSERLGLIQVVDVTGIWGLSFIVAAVNAATAVALIERRAGRSVTWAAPVLAASLVLAVWGYGMMRLRSIDAAARAGEADAAAHRPMRSGGAFGTQHTRARRAGDAVAALRVAVVQGNVRPGLRDSNAEERSFSLYRNLTLEEAKPSASIDAAWTAEEPSLVIWPETTLRVVLPRYQRFREEVFDLAQSLRQPLLVGSLDVARDGQSEFNSLFVVSPARALSGVYHKTVLLPFGEAAPPLAAWWHTTGPFVRGEPAKLLSIELAGDGFPDRAAAQGAQDASRETLRFAPSICYEAMFPGFFNRLVRGGADFLVNITDDSWFGDSQEPWQHLQGTIFRAVETRRVLVRASNSGISAIIQPSGRITARTPLLTRAVMRGTIRPAHGRTTLYVQWGDWFAWLCVLTVVVAFLMGARGAPHARRTSQVARGRTR